jgi:transcriptional regulator with XRE-family HTH domain
MLDATLGHRLHQARKGLRWSRQGVADLIGCKHVTLYRYETGTREPPLVLVTWLEALATEMAALLDRIPSPFTPDIQPKELSDVHLHE